MPRKATKKAPAAAPAPEGARGQVAAMDVTMTAASGMGGDGDKTPLALRVERAMNDAGEQARITGASPDQILQAKIRARGEVMQEVTGEAPAPAAAGPRKTGRKGAKKAASKAQRRTKAAK